MGCAGPGRRRSGRLPVTGGAAPERSLPIVGGPGDAAGLVGQVAGLGVRLEARPGGRLWADRPDLLPTALRDSLAARRPAVVALLAAQAAQLSQPRARGYVLVADAPPPATPALPGVPPNWCKGLALLTTRPAPPTIPPRRWAVLAATCARLLQDHGAALHGAGWDALDLFGLNITAPATNPPGWGLAWLLGEHGEVLDVAPDVIGMRWGPDGARLVFRRTHASTKVAIVPAWKLIEVQI